LGRVWSAATAAELREMMREAVRSGTGRTANLSKLQVCGKTGTAEAPGGGDHAWFTCFAPRRHPELVVTVLVEKGGYGSQAAAPIARAVLQEAVDLGLLGEGTNEGVPAADGKSRNPGAQDAAVLSGLTFLSDPRTPNLDPLNPEP
jgi:membrane peptidoglycan carboxypeptidase